jgi:hypothetical protein
MRISEALSPSLRAKRSNPSGREASMDCFVAALLAMTAGAVTDEEALKDQE